MPLDEPAGSSALTESAQRGHVHLASALERVEGFQSVAPGSSTGYDRAAENNATWNDERSQPTGTSDEPVAPGGWFTRIFAGETPGSTDAVATSRPLGSQDRQL